MYPDVCIRNGDERTAVDEIDRGVNGTDWSTWSVNLPDVPVC